MAKEESYSIFLPTLQAISKLRSLKQQLYISTHYSVGSLGSSGFFFSSRVGEVTHTVACSWLELEHPRKLFFFSPGSVSIWPLIIEKSNLSLFSSSPLEPTKHMLRNQTPVCKHLPSSIIHLLMPHWPKNVT